MKDMQCMFYATEAWGQKSKWVKRKRLHCTDMPTWSKGEKVHEGGDERCLGATNFEMISNYGQKNAKGEPEGCNIFREKKRQKQRSWHFMENPQYTHGGGRSFFWDLKWNVVENLNPSWRKETMNEEATTVQATQPPSGLPELIFRRFCFSSKLDLCV